MKYRLIVSGSFFSCGLYNVTLDEHSPMRIYHKLGFQPLNNSKCVLKIALVRTRFIIYTTVLSASIYKNLGSFA